MSYRYFGMRSKQGPEEQIGIVLRSDYQRALQDLTSFLDLNLVREASGYHDYEANTNVNLCGVSQGEDDIVGLRVLEDARVMIYRQPSKSMDIKEIDQTRAEQIVRRLDILREGSVRGVKSVAPPTTFGLLGFGNLNDIL